MNGTPAVLRHTHIHAVTHNTCERACEQFYLSAHVHWISAKNNVIDPYVIGIGITRKWNLSSRSRGIYKRQSGESRGGRWLGCSRDVNPVHLDINGICTRHRYSRQLHTSESFRTTRLTFLRRRCIALARALRKPYINQQRPQIMIPCKRNGTGCQRIVWWTHRPLQRKAPHFLVDGFFYVPGSERVATQMASIYVTEDKSCSGSGFALPK